MGMTLRIDSCGLKISFDPRQFEAAHAIWDWLSAPAPGRQMLVFAGAARTGKQFCAIAATVGVVLHAAPATAWLIAPEERMKRVGWMVERLLRWTPYRREENAFHTCNGGVLQLFTPKDVESLKQGTPKAIAWIAAQAMDHRVFTNCARALDEQQHSLGVMTVHIPTPEDSWVNKLVIPPDPKLGFRLIHFPPREEVFHAA